jgi:ribonuclease HI
VSAALDLRPHLLYTDARFCKRSAGLGAVLYSPDGKELLTRSQLVVCGCSTMAEVRAGAMGLRLALNEGVERVILRMDAQGAVVYLSQSAPQLRAKFRECEVEWVSRTQNRKAHALAKAAFPSRPAVPPLAPRREGIKRRCERCFTRHWFADTEAAEAWCGICTRCLERLFAAAP